MPVKFVLILIAFLIPGGIAFSQQQSIDSLQAVVKGNASDAEKIKACLALAQHFLVKDFDECLAISETGAALAASEKNDSYYSEFQKTIGISYYFKGNYDSAAAYYYRSLDVLNRVNNPEQKAGVLNELGKLYRKTRDLDRSLQMYDEAYALYKSTNNIDGMATIMNESGVVFEYKGDFKEAIKRYQQSLNLREKMNDVSGKAYSINFIGGVYTQMRDFQNAEKYLLQSLEIRKELKDTFAIALNYADLGFMYNEKGDLDKAAQQYQLSNEIASRMKFPDLLLENYKVLSDVAEKRGDAHLSLDYYKKHIALKDSIFSNNKMKQIEELNARYQAEKKEQQLALQQAQIIRKNYLLVGLIIAVILAALWGFAFFRKRKVQQELRLQATVMKQQNLATKAVIKAEEDERQRIAADLHDGVGQMMSAAKMNLSAFESDINFTDPAQKESFDKVLALVDESCREIRAVSHQMMPNALLKSGLANAVREFIDRIDSRVLRINLHAEGLQERLDSNVETVMYRVIQECVNNVIKHSGATQLDISLIKDVDGISVTIEDNGKGFDATDKQKFEGIGLKNIISRINYLNGEIDFDSSEGNGTLVAIHVPLS